MARSATFSLYTIITLVVSIAFLVLLFIYGNAPKTPSLPPKDIQPVVCASVVDRCRATIEAKLESSADHECSEQRAMRRLQLLLGEPLGLGDCRDAVIRLDLNCPQNCMLDPKSNLVVPSQPEFRLAERPDESGNCAASASMDVTIRGRCVPIPNAPKLKN